MGPALAELACMARSPKALVLTAAALMMAACSMTATNEAGRGDTTSHTGFSGSDASDSARIDRLEREALALAITDGCTTADQCGVAPVGAKACGGPRFWITYCPVPTDTAALFQKLEELRTAEQAFNEAHGVISDCSVVPRPTPVVSAGVCRLGER